MIMFLKQVQISHKINFSKKCLAKTLQISIQHGSQQSTIKFVFKLKTQIMKYKKIFPFFQDKYL